ncbi:hypothetical protein CsatB_027685 [Cannabis sativa]
MSSSSLTIRLGSNNDAEIKTTIIKNESALEEALSSLLSKTMNTAYNSYNCSTLFDLLPLHTPRTTLVGFGIEKSFRTSPTTPYITQKVALIKFCIGKECLIVHLTHFSTIPTCLAIFLDFSSLIFLGMRIKQDMVDLQRDYGLSCRYFVDLGQLGASVKNRSCDEFYDLLLLVHGCNGYTNSYNYDPIELGEGTILTELSNKHCILGFCDWGAYTLSEEQIKQATMDSYAALFVGVKCLSDRKYIRNSS